MADTAEMTMEPGAAAGLPSEFGGIPTAVEKPAQIKGDDDFIALKPGSKFVGPDGKTRVKLWQVTNDQDYASVPEGEQFIDPKGKTRQKPKFDPISFTSQTLYDMSVTSSEKKRALERSYPGKVKEDAEGLYVEDDGKFRRPGRGAQAISGFAAAAAAPVVGTAVGAIGGGTMGPATGALGAVGGSILGQSINDVVLQLAGVYDRSVPEQAATTGMAGASGLMGFGVGRGIATMVPATKAGISSVGQMLPTVAGKFLGAGPEITQARELAEKGVMVPPSAWAHEAPHLQNVVEVFDPAFRTNKVLGQSATEHYENSAKKVLDDLGVKDSGSVVKLTADIPTQKAGEIVLQKILAESAAADQKLAAALEQRKAEVISGATAVQAQRETVTKAAEESRQAAQKLIDEGFSSIQREADAAMKVAQAGANTGDLWDSIGKKFMALRQGIGERANYWYNRYDEMTGGYKPNLEGLSGSAKQVLDELPQEFQSKYPDVVRKLQRLTGVENEAGEVVKEAESLTMGEIHNLRSLFRGNADWYNLASDFRNGTWKHFSNEIDGLIHDPSAPAHVQSAAKFLDMVDKWYGHNISVFNAQQIKAVMKGLEAGESADPGNLYRVLVKEGQTDLTRRVRDMVGPNLWAGVRGADVDAMLNASKTLNPGEINGRSFAKEVLDRHQRGILEIVHGKEASEKLLSQARAIEQLEGRLSIPVKQGDTMTQVIARARLAAEEAKAVGTKDPLLALEKDVKRVQNEMKREASAARKEDPLGFLYNKSTGASYAVDKILGDEDLILAAAARFGEKSPEFNALRQVYVERVLRAGMRPAQAMKEISPEVQNLMFPGVTRKQMDVLASEMEMLMPRRGMSKTTAGSMSAMSKVENPVSGVPGIRSGMKLIPGLNPAARAVKTQYYSLVTELMTSPAVLRWIEKGITKGTAEEREAVREILRRHLQKGGTVGAATGEAIYQGSGE